jgi:hypothetical protein
MKSPVLVVFLLLTALGAFGQTESARISGRVTDLTGAVIVGAECKITNIETNVSTSTTTNEDGIYVLPDLHPAIYQLTIQKEGFRTVVQPSLQLYVQDAINENFTLAIGPASESVTVLSDAFGIRTDSAAVSTVVDDQFVQNMPLNGRSFQPLIALTPGVVFTSQNLGQGQFSANGQRSNANYFMVDGVSANFGVTISGLGQTLGGAIPGFSAQGGTNGLVSVDAMQEFRIQTSSYAAEFGHTPGSQVSIVTKSGGNQFHGTAFNYLRNNIFDARNYFDAPPFPSRRSARMTLAVRLAVQSAKTKLSSSFLTKGCDCGCRRRTPGSSLRRQRGRRLRRPINLLSTPCRFRLRTRLSSTPPAITSQIHALRTSP